MAKLVDNPADAAVFLPRLLPGLEKVSQEVPDPECRSVASKARDTLLKLVQDPAAAAPAEAHDFKVGFWLMPLPYCLVYHLLPHPLDLLAAGCLGGVCALSVYRPLDSISTLLWVLQVVLPVLKDIEAKHSKAALGSVSSAITSVTLEYVAAMCSTLIQVKNFDIEDWEMVRIPMSMNPAVSLQPCLVHHHCCLSCHFPQRKLKMTRD